MVLKRNLQTRCRDCRTRIDVLLVVLLLLVGTTNPVNAHGTDRALLAADLAAGSYRLTVWTVPGELRPGEIHVQTATVDERGMSVRDHHVSVALRFVAGQGESDQTVVSSPVKGTNGVIQEGALIVKRPGRYRLSLTVEGSGGERGRAHLFIDVASVPVVVQWSIGSLLVASLVAFVWLLWQSKRIWGPGGTLCR